MTVINAGAGHREKSCETICLTAPFLWISGGHTYLLPFMDMTGLIRQGGGQLI